MISADSRQVYRGLDIGTAKATTDERRRDRPPRPGPRRSRSAVQPGRLRRPRPRRRWPRSRRGAGSPSWSAAPGCTSGPSPAGIDTDALPADARLRARLEAEFRPSGSIRSSSVCGQRAPSGRPAWTCATRGGSSARSRSPRSTAAAAATRPRGYDGPVAWLGLEVDRATHLEWIAARARAQFDAGLIEEAAGPARALRPGAARLLGDRLSRGVGRPRPGRRGRAAGCTGVDGTVCLTAARSGLSPPRRWARDGDRLP